MAKEKKVALFVPSEQQFAVSKVKLAKNGGVTILYDVTEVIGEESYTNKFLVESAKDLHPDFVECFNKLRPILGRIFNLISFLSLVETPEFKATAKMKEQAREFADEVLKLVEARSISLSGKDDNVGVVISGLMTTGNNKKTAINSPLLKFNSEVYGFEEELEEICGDIEKEAYQFLFKGKKAQLELFGAAGNDEDDEHKNADEFPDVDDPATDEAEETETEEENEEGEQF